MKNSKNKKKNLKKNSKNKKMNLKKNSKNKGKNLIKKEFEEKFKKQGEEFDKKFQKQEKECEEKFIKRGEEFDKKLQKQEKEFEEKFKRQEECFLQKLQKLEVQVNQLVNQRKADLKYKIVSNRFQLVLEKGIICNVKNTKGEFLFRLDPVFVPKVHLEDSIIPMFSSYQEAKIEVEKRISKIPNHGYLTENEIKSILFYTFEPNMSDGIYKVINRLLAQRRKIDGWTNYLFYLTSALSKCPRDYGIVFRGIQSDKNLLEDNSTQYVPGRNVVWVGLTSCSKNQQTAQDFFQDATKPFKILFEIEQYSGRNIKDFSLIPEEEEVLLPPNTVFEVVSVERRTSKFYFVRLKEIVGEDLFKMIEIEFH
eukprot:TRINITY_DN1650_c1_g1_i5.p1 TRINITY_DN1650_c1_g1~~TRINITY_DN1650_c1_g1_i5.p1  ORF type:complete len:366 (-),score=106.55 TRINITY_DN1650_c1_g1_i5:43-1140(-)